MPASRVLMLGDGDLELESSLAVGIDGPVDRSAAGLDVPAETYDVVALSRDLMFDRRRRRHLLAAAARAVAPRGTVVAEVPNLLATLSRPLLAFEGLTTLPLRRRGGTTYGGCRRLARAAGLGRLSGLLCLPSLADPRIVLPLDSAAALSFHFRPPFYVETWRRRILRRLLAATARAGLLRSMSPGFTLFATREAES